MIKAVFLDIDNTLLDFDRCVANSMKSGLEEHGIEFREEMFGTFKTINDSLWLRIEQGTMTRERLMEVRWRMVFDELGIGLDGPEFEKYFRAALYDSAEPMPGAAEALAYLGPKYRIFAASNGPYEQQRHRLERAGMLSWFEELFVSSSLGFSKPMKEFFSACFALAGDVSPEESVMIGDSLTADIGGGAAAGMKTVWLNQNGAALPEDLKPDCVISSLYEIKDLPIFKGG